MEQKFLVGNLYQSYYTKQAAESAVQFEWKATLAFCFKMF